MKENEYFSTTLVERINFLGALERFWGGAWPTKACIAKVLMDGTSHTYPEKFVSNDVLFSHIGWIERRIGMDTVS
jgi:hypothetical protein